MGRSAVGQELVLVRSVQWCVFGRWFGSAGQVDSSQPWGQPRSLFIQPACVQNCVVLPYMSPDAASISAFTEL